MIPIVYTNVTGGLIYLKRFSQLGAATTVLPDAVLNEGAALGAMSLVTKSLNEWSIYAGDPLNKYN